MSFTNNLADRRFLTYECILGNHESKTQYYRRKEIHVYVLLKFIDIMGLQGYLYANLFHVHYTWQLSINIFSLVCVLFI
jgi:hypothetical protein